MNNEKNALFLYYNDIKDYKKLSLDEERIYGKDLKLKDTLFILDKSDKRTKIDIKKLLFYINEKEQINTILKKVESFLYIDNNNNTESIKLIHSYKDLVNKLGRIPTHEELKILLNINIENEIKIDDNFLANEVEKYFKYKRAFNKFIEGNVNLVLAVITRTNKVIINDDGFLDLISQGNLILTECIDRFDIDLGYKFSTFAFNTIKKELINYLIKNKYSNSLSYNTDIFYDVKSFLLKKEELEKKYGRQLSYKELSKELNISIETIISYYNIIENSIYHAISLDSPIYTIKDSEEIKYKDIIPNPPIDEVPLQPDEVKMILKYLDKDEAEIIKLLFGIDTEKPLSSDKISKKLHKSKFVVSKKIESAMNKLRRLGMNNPEIKELKNR